MPKKLPRIPYCIISKIDSCCAIGSYYGGRAYKVSFKRIFLLLFFYKFSFLSLFSLSWSFPTQLLDHVLFLDCTKIPYCAGVTDIYCFAEYITFQQPVTIQVGKNMSYELYVSWAVARDDLENEYSPFSSVVEACTGGNLMNRMQWGSNPLNCALSLSRSPNCLMHGS